MKIVLRIWLMCLAVTVLVSPEATGTGKQGQRRREARLESQLALARGRYSRQLIRAKQGLYRSIQAAVRRVHQDRSLSPATEEQLLQELEHDQISLKQSGGLPKSELMIRDTVRFLDTVNTAREPVSKAFGNLIEYLEQDSDLKAAQAVRDRWEEFERRLPGASRFGSRSVWRGSRHFKTLNTDIEIRVAESDGNTFECFIRQNRGNTRMRAKGIVQGNRISIRTTEIVRGKPRSLHFSGYVIGDRLILGTSGITVSGSLASDYALLRRV